jgi:hypothetical protein
MFAKKLLGFSAAGISLVIVALGFLSPTSRTSISDIFKEKIYNSLSGREGSDGPILVVKIDDTKMARPQIGLEYADIVYIEQVEGGLTRLAALYSSVIPREVGPVRSARISDLELLAQFGKIGFAYSGAQTKLRPEISVANLFDLGAQSLSSKIYTTDPSRISPYAMVLRADLLMEYAGERGYAFAKSKSAGWNFSDETSLGKPIVSAKVNWPASSYEVRWSKEKGKWELFHAQQPNLSSSGSVLTADTFVIQLVSITDSIYKDKVGGVTPFSATIGSGRGFILRDGKYVEGIWTRSSAESGTTWKTSSGEEIPFARGSIWVALTDKEPIFTPISADAPVGQAK